LSATPASVTPGIPACLSGFSACRMTMSFMQSPPCSDYRRRTEPEFELAVALDEQ
jgi:hypothetical protein